MEKKDRSKKKINKKIREEKINHKISNKVGLKTQNISRNILKKKFMKKKIYLNLNPNLMSKICCYHMQKKDDIRILNCYNFYFFLIRMGIVLMLDQFLHTKINLLPVPMHLLVIITNHQINLIRIQHPKNQIKTIMRIIHLLPFLLIQIPVVIIQAFNQPFC